MRAHSSMNDAIAKLLKVIADNPQRWDAYQQLARVLLRNDEFDAAEQYFLQAIQLKPDAQILHLQLADLQMRTQQFKAAHESYKKAIKLQPKQAQIYFLDAQALKNMGRANEAILRLRTAFKLTPNHLQAFTDCVDLLLKQSQTTEAADVLTHAIQHHPENALLHFRLGLLKQQLKDLEEALACFKQATEIQPEFAEAHHQYALLLHATGKLDDAVKNFDTAIHLQPHVPSAYNNRGVVLCQMRKFSPAIADFKQAIALNPSYAAAYCNLGVAQYEHGEEAVAYHTLITALKYDPTHVQAQYTLSLLKLSRGEYDTGWSLYESRWKIKPAPHRLNETLKWHGQTHLLGKTILIFAEQSLSDTLQFCRYIPLLKQYKPNQIIVEVQESLFALLNQHWSIEPLIQVIKAGERLPHYDVYCPMLGLPDAFKTRLHNIPDHLPYLSVAQNNQQPWLDLLGPSRRLRVGLNWCGDANTPQDQLRSIPLFKLAALLQISVEWHSLQKEFRREDHIILKRFPMLECHHPQLADFTDTAGLIMQMDLIISVDTAVAHLSAALGKPVWLLLPEHSHFRWLQNRTDSPWYPGMRLFRMQNYQQWEDLIDEVYQALTERTIAQRRSQPRPAPLIAKDSEEDLE